MKKLFFIAVAALMFVACAKPEKTIENLKAAATGESNASAMYAAFAGQATADSLFNIAAMLRATSAAEAIHASNHLAELAKLGVTDFVPVVNPVTIATTAENLVTANAGEEYEFTTMYPDFIAVAQQEKAQGAEQVFDWANSAEKSHSVFYKAAIEALAVTGNDATVAGVWYVCPKCGDTFAAGEQGVACPLCGTDVAKYVECK